MCVTKLLGQEPKRVESVFDVIEFALENRSATALPYFQSIDFLDKTALSLQNDSSVSWFSMATVRSIERIRYWKSILENAVWK